MRVSVSVGLWAGLEDSHVHGYSRPVPPCSTCLDSLDSCPRRWPLNQDHSYPRSLLWGLCISSRPSDHALVPHIVCFITGLDQFDEALALGPLLPGRHPPFCFGLGPHEHPFFMVRLSPNPEYQIMIG